MYIYIYIHIHLYIYICMMGQRISKKYIFYVCDHAHMYIYIHIGIYTHPYYPLIIPRKTKGLKPCQVERNARQLDGQPAVKLYGIIMYGRF